MINHREGGRDPAARGEGGAECSKGKRESEAGTEGRKEAAMREWLGSQVMRKMGFPLGTKQDPLCDVSQLFLKKESPGNVLVHLIVSEYPAVEGGRTPDTILLYKLTQPPTPILRLEEFKSFLDAIP